MDLSGARNALDEYGFIHLPGTTLFGIAGITDQFPAFARQWDDLPVDPYLGDGVAYRLRRHARMVVDADGYEILPRGEYTQSTAHNPLFGGVRRWFSPIDWTPATEAVLCALVTASVARVLRWPGRTLVNLHMVRIVGTPGEPGTPVPEGPHRDGFEFISIHMIGRDIDGGGETSVLDDDGAIRHKLSLSEPLDAVYIDDRRLRHYTSPIVGTGRRVHRDVLLMSFEPA